MKAIMVIGHTAGTCLKARDMAHTCGRFVIIQWGEDLARFKTMSPDFAIIVEGVSHPEEWTAQVWAGVRLMVTRGSRLILVLQQGIKHVGAAGEFFEIVYVGHGGRRDGAGVKRGSTRVVDARSHLASQRYTSEEFALISRMAGGKVGEFIRDAAVDRARAFEEAEQ